MSEAQKPTTNAYREGWQTIWGKKQPIPDWSPQKTTIKIGDRVLDTDKHEWERVL